MKHPNTIAGLIAVGAAWGITTVLAHYGIHLTKNQSHELDLGSVGAVLFVGRRGIKNTALAIFSAVWKGSDAAQATPAALELVAPAPEPEQPATT